MPFLDPQLYGQKAEIPQSACTDTVAVNVGEWAEKQDEKI